MGGVFSLGLFFSHFSPKSLGGQEGGPCCRFRVLRGVPFPPRPSSAPPGLLLSAPQIQLPSKTLGTPSMPRGGWGQHPLSWPHFGLQKHHFGQTDPKAGGKGVTPGAPARTIPPCPPGPGPRREPRWCPHLIVRLSVPLFPPPASPQSIWDFPFIFFPIFNRRPSQNPLRGTPPIPFFLLNVPSTVVF